MDPPELASEPAPCSAHRGRIEPPEQKDPPRGQAREARKPLNGQPASQWKTITNKASENKNEQKNQERKTPRGKRVKSHAAQWSKEKPQEVRPKSGRGPEANNSWLRRHLTDQPPSRHATDASHSEMVLPSSWDELAESLIRDRLRLTRVPSKFEGYLQKITDHFRGNPNVSVDDAGWVAVMPGSASASWREATFQSRMQVQIQEWLD